VACLHRLGKSSEMNQAKQAVIGTAGAYRERLDQL
jgi:hypothetical protein